MWKNYQKLLSTKNANKEYLKFKSEPIDTVLSEKVKNGIVVHGTFDWADVGSFHELHDISLQDDEGNYLHGNSIATESTTNSYVRNETGTPVAVIGLDGVVVVSTVNGILVSNKNYAQKVGEVSKRLQTSNEQRSRKSKKS